MSSVTPGRETDAAVARALGKSICPHEECNDAECDASVVAHASDGLLHRGDMPGSPVWSPSTVEADALAALEATGEPWGLVFQKGGKYGCNIGPSHTWHYAPTLCLAASAAILAWAEGKGGK